MGELIGGFEVIFSSFISISRCSQSIMGSALGLVIRLGARVELLDLSLSIHSPIYMSPLIADVAYIWSGPLIADKQSSIRTWWFESYWILVCISR